MKKTKIVVWMIALSLIPGSLFALDLGKVQVNGFVSQGYMKTQDNSFLDPKSDDGTFGINEFGLTINAPVTDKLRIGMQFLSRDLGEEGNNDVELDWAFGDYRFEDWAGVRAGKIKLPIGLYNETRDSDFLRSMAFLPQSIYDEARRSFLVAGVGASLYGNVSAGNAGDFDYNVFYGEIDIDDDTYLVKEGIEKPLQGQLGASSLEYESDYTFAGSLIYNPPIDGLRLGYSYFRSMGEWDVDDSAAGPFVVTANIKYLWVVSAEYVLPEISFHAEYMQRDNDVRIPILDDLGQNGDKEVTVSEGGYFMVTYPVPALEGLSLSAMYDVFYLDKDNHDGSTANGDEKIGWRKDFGFGARYDFNPNFLVKAEWHTVDGCAPNMDLYTDGALEEDWDYYIVKASFNF